MKAFIKKGKIRAVGVINQKRHAKAVANLGNTANIDNIPKIVGVACLDFLREVPTTWDETRYIDGRPGEHVALARRNGNKWYVAAINACDPVLKYNVWEMIEEIKDGGKADWKTAKGSVVKIYEGGNTPVVRNVPAGDLYKTDITVEKNDGVVIVFEVE